jgi:hypothetical protein
MGASSCSYQRVIDFDDSVQNIIGSSNGFYSGSIFDYTDASQYLSTGDNVLDRVDILEKSPEGENNFHQTGFFTDELESRTIMQSLWDVGKNTPIEADSFLALPHETKVFQDPIWHRGIGIPGTMEVDIANSHPAWPASPLARLPFSRNGECEKLSNSETFLADASVFAEFPTISGCDAPITVLDNMEIEILHMTHPTLKQISFHSTGSAGIHNGQDVTHEIENSPHSYDPNSGPPNWRKHEPSAPIESTDLEELVLEPAKPKRFP